MLEAIATGLTLLALWLLTELAYRLTERRRRINRRLKGVGLR